ncbi:MAG TPA: endonuclease/exonuclease/phosphatase family protein [Solirubrobacteraceae bacterium]|nr:endonuclease/exonuclease/phosphatase family protein [Solirubrobacteraceae bacterium]
MRGRREIPRAPRPTRDRVIAVVVATPWVLWAVLRTLGLERGHPLTALVAFSPYAAALAPVPVAVALLLRRRAVATVAAVAAVALLAAMLPRVLPGPRRAEADAGGRTLVVMSANLLIGQADPAAVVRLVREHDVDVLSLQELTPDALRRLDDADVRSLLPGRAVRTDGHWSGLGLLARAPLRAVRPRPGSASTQLEALMADRDGAWLRVVAIHPLPPVSPANTRAWRRALRNLPGPCAGGVPRVLLGDFNATLDHREMRRLLDRGYVDAAEATGDGLRMTWPTTADRPPLTIDHVLFASPIRVRRFSLHNVAGSDHRALIAELVLAPG